MNENVDYIAEYLANDLSSTNLYDIDSVRAKIRASLQIFIDDNVKTTVTEKLRKKVNTHIFVSKKQDIELKFWKDVARGLLPEKNDINKYYEQIDSILVERGYKVLKTCT